MAGTKAWMLRQDGEAFACGHHFYVMYDEDLSSEAEVSAFLIKSNSKDQDLSRYILDAWMALLIENEVSYDADADAIDDAILVALSELPYHFQYKMSDTELLAIHKSENNYNDVDTLYDFIDSFRIHIHELSNDLAHSLNQQFCRVRYGGQYDSSAGNSSIWFRISSVGFNWVNVIYLFVASLYKSYNIEYITICRDYESDNGEVEGKPEYFYKAKDGAVYYQMPIEEYLAEEHEHNPVFSRVTLNSGVLHTIRNRLALGDTPTEIISALDRSGIDYNQNFWNYLVRKERMKCVESSESLDNAPIRSQGKIRLVMRQILSQYPEIKDIDVDIRPYNNRNGKPVGVEYVYELSSNTPELDGLKVGTAFTKSSIPADTMLRQFKREYEDYINARGIRLQTV